MSSIDQLSADYQSTGLAAIPVVLPAAVCSTIVERVGMLTTRAIPLWLDRKAQDYGVSGSVVRHGLIDGVAVREHLLEIQTLYHALHPLVAALTGQTIVSGLYPLSDVNVVIYQRGSVKGPHFDTVPISMVLFLTSHPCESDQGALCYESLTGHVTEHFPRAGDICLFQGRKVRHWIKPLTEPLVRIVVNANYYTTDDHVRDPGVDNLLYSRSHDCDAS
jgi:hypothetical protein